MTEKNKKRMNPYKKGNAGFECRMDFNIRESSIDEGERTVELAFSSEKEVSRWYGVEILKHKGATIRLERINDGGALLVNHRMNEHVGVIESARLDSDGVCRAVVRFGRGAYADEIFNDVVDGIRTKVSFMYRVYAWEEKKGENGVPNTYTATDWEPLEISIVSIPADETVGVGRSLEENVMENEDDVVVATEDGQRSVTPAATSAAPETPTVDVNAERKGAATNERKRVNDILQLADQHDLETLGRDYIDNGKSVADFQRAILDEIGKRNNEVRANRDPNIDSDSIGMSDNEVSQYSMLRLMRHMASPDNSRLAEEASFERDCSSAAENAMGIQARGIIIPSDVLRRDLSAGTATDGAELVGTDLLAGEFIDVLRNSMVIGQAGARTLDGLVGNVDIPKKISGAAGAFLSTEDDDAAESEAQFGQVQMTPKDCAAYTEVTRRLMQQSTPSIEGIIRDDLFQAIALALDSAAFYGSGAGGNPRGISNTTNVNTTDLTGGLSFADSVNMIKEVMLDNALMGNLAYIFGAGGWEAGMTTLKDAGSGKFVISENGTCNGYKALATNQVVQNDWFFGNWADLLIGLWGGLDLNVDPYTHSLKGKTRFVVFQTADIAVRHGESFTYADTV